MNIAEIARRNREDLRLARSLQAVIANMPQGPKRRYVELIIRDLMHGK